MKIHNNYNLSKLNTFGISVNARFLVEVNNEEELKELFSNSELQKKQKVFLGGGSNVLFTKDFGGLVVLNKLKGIEILEQDSDIVTIRCMGGEIWHDLVNFSVDRGLWGIENLAFIPGTVGAAPMQNIGAYGVELKDVLENVEVYVVDTGEKRVFSKEECKLGYRDSIFKNDLKGKFFISAITIKLSKKENKNISYKILQEYLEKNKVEVSSSRDISCAVTCIRRSKLPDPAIIPNAGSFFKNVFLKKDELQRLQKDYPDASYFEEDGLFKVPAGWLIEQCGWKGKRTGKVGVHDKQALVLVNHGGATGEEIQDLAKQITDSVFLKFGLKLVPEVNLI